MEVYTVYAFLHEVCHASIDNHYYASPAQNVSDNVLVQWCTADLHSYDSFTEAG